MHACTVEIEEITAIYGRAFFLHEKKKQNCVFVLPLAFCTVIENLGSPCAKQRCVSLSLSQKKKNKAPHKFY